VGEIVRLDVETILDIPPDTVLDGAKSQLQQVVVVGTTVDGDEYFASSTGYLPDVLWALQRAAAKLLNNEL
jgi:hypothetical protein